MKKLIIVLLITCFLIPAVPAFAGDETVALAGITAISLVVVYFWASSNKKEFIKIEKKKNWDVGIVAVDKTIPVFGLSITW